MDEGASVRNALQTISGAVEEIRERRPKMARVKWEDGREGWYHPEQLAMPCTAVMPEWTPPTKTTAPEYLVSLKKETPPKERRKLTPEDRERIAIALVCKGSGTAKQFYAVGLRWPPPKGWRKRLMKAMRWREKKPNMGKPYLHHAPNNAEQDRQSMKVLYQAKTERSTVIPAATRQPPSPRRAGPVSR